MLVFPHAKINLGLVVGQKRPDGYHNINTCFFPIPVFDALEITPHEKLKFLTSGLEIPGDPRKNLCLKAYQILKDEFDIPPVRIHLYKKIPFGAGLGGGSADGAYALKALSELFDLNLDSNALEKYALELGSDCPYFIAGGKQIGAGRGEVLTSIDIDLKGKWILLVNPKIHISTGEAYQICEKSSEEIDLLKILGSDQESWVSDLGNSFQMPLEDKHPDLKQLRESLYELGAFYASMSGSGSSYFGIFKDEPKLLPKDYIQFKFQL